MTIKTKSLCSLTLLLLATLLSGCKKNSVDRLDVAGTISWGGKPIKAGYVTFTPDIRKGGSGPGGVAIIKDGVFDTRFEKGKGPSPGPQIVSILAYDGGTSDDNPLGKRLFADYKIELTVEGPMLDQKIDVPEKIVSPPKN
jgi:hypothetical protein